MVRDGGGGARFKAFLSYSHKDASHARWLHRRLEGYRLPRRLVGSEGERGPVPARLAPIFRDRDELPAAGSLSDTVRAALADSDNLIVLCSPHSAASPWVAKEIETFRALHPDRPVFAAIVDGDPAQCFPGCLTADGAEPLAADLRRQGDGHRLGLLKLVAGLAGTGLDALVQRDAQRRLKRVMAVTVGALLGLLITSVLAIVAVTARAEAERQRAEAEGLVEFMLTDLRDKLKGVGRLDVLTTANQRALRYSQGQDLEGLSTTSLERRARILHAMGEDDITRGAIDRALDQFREAARSTSRLLEGQPDDPERIFVHAQSEYWLGNVSEQRGDYPSALASYRRYRDLSVQLNQVSSPNARSLGELGYAESNLGIVAINGLRQPKRARKHFLRSLESFRHAHALDREDSEWISEVADAHAWLADTWFAERRFVEAERERLLERSIKQALLSRDPKNRSLLYSCVITDRALARIQLERGHLNSATATLKRAATTMSSLRALEPANARWREQAARIELDWARVHLAAGRHNDVADSLSSAEAMLHQSKGSEVTATEKQILESVRTIRNSNKER